jgi:hypothetical protein
MVPAKDTLDVTVQNTLPQICARRRKFYVVQGTHANLHGEKK